MKKLLLIIFIFTGLSSIAFSHNGTGGIRATHGEAYSAFADASLFVGGQPENGVVFYPNPVKDYMSVRFPQRGNHTVRIYNIIGESITEKTALDVEILEINLSDLPKGMYFVSYELGGKVITKRFSKS
ncbi:MAG: T9SS type A sorting domain-containing protein [Bacteroidia bacterium]